MREIGIIARHDSWREAPWDNPAVEMWVFGLMYPMVPRADRFYELHTRAELDRCLAEGIVGQEYLDWLSTTRTPVYMHERYADIPASERFPIDGVMADLGDYFTSTVALMLAHAIYEHRHGSPIGVIHLYGVTMQNETEYGTQQPCAAYYVGYARGLGIDVQIARSSRLCKAATVYGYEWPTRHEVCQRGILRGISAERIAAVEAGMAERAAMIAAAKAQYQQGVICE